MEQLVGMSKSKREKIQNKNPPNEAAMCQTMSLPLVCNTNVGVLWCCFMLVLCGGVLGWC